jgi:hypothetical protein
MLRKDLLRKDLLRKDLLRMDLLRMDLLRKDLVRKDLFRIFSRGVVTPTNLLSWTKIKINCGLTVAQTFDVFVKILVLPCWEN